MCCCAGSDGGGNPTKRSRLSPTDDEPPRKAAPPSDASKDGNRRKEAWLLRRSAEGASSKAADTPGSSSPAASLPVGSARQPPPPQQLNRLAGQALSSLGAQSRSYSRPADTHSAAACSSRVAVSGPGALASPPTQRSLPAQLPAARRHPIPSSGGSHPTGPVRMKSAAERHLDPLPPLNRGPTRPKAKSALVSFSPPRHPADLSTGKSPPFPPS